MSKEYIASFSSSFLDVMPQLGITEVKLNDEIECSNIIESPGVVVIIGMIGDLHGNLIFAMHEDCAKQIASIMMGGMEVLEFDEIVQSAISELSNMLAANACTNLSAISITADISTPILMHGDFTAAASFNNVTRLEMQVNDLPFYIYVSLEQK